MDGQSVAPELESSTQPVFNHEAHDISNDYEIPAPLPSTSMSALKERIKGHYEICSDYYYSLWGEHIHHGYFLHPEDSKEIAQIRLIELLLDLSKLPHGNSVLDVGCGIGGTTRYLAGKIAGNVTGITISGEQVRIAKDLTAKEARPGQVMKDGSAPLKLNDGTVRFIELDAERMGEFFTKEPNKTTFDTVWISEAMSHLPDKKLFFQNAEMLLNPGGKLVVADWFKAEGMTDSELEADIRPIEDGMLLPPLCTQPEYVKYAKDAGLQVHTKPFDISKEVSKTWDISWSLIQSPALWALAFSHGRDGIAFFQAFRAMRRGYANGTFRYAVMVFQK